MVNVLGKFVVHGGTNLVIALAVMIVRGGEEGLISTEFGGNGEMPKRKTSASPCIHSLMAIRDGLVIQGHANTAHCTIPAQSFVLGALLASTLLDLRPAHCFAGAPPRLA